MKNLVIILSLLIISNNGFCEQAKSFQDSHSSIYTKKLIQIVSAINVGEFSTEKEYKKMLDTACERSRCSSQEKQTIQLMGQEITNCKINHLKSHGIENSDAKNICESKQAMLGCDTLATPLLRKMCYTGNQYNLQVLKLKELKLKKRQPASK